MNLETIAFYTYFGLCLFSLFVFVKLLAGNDRYRVFANPLVSFSIFIIGILAGTILIFKFGAAFLLIVILGGAMSLLPTYTVADKFSNSFLKVATRNIRIIRECPHGEAAERQGDLKKAEELYKKDLTGRDKMDYFVNLKLGNLYAKQEKKKLAAQHWEKSLYRDLPPELYIATSLRLSDLYKKLNNAKKSKEILETAIRLYPNKPETESLKKRLES